MEDSTISQQIQACVDGLPGEERLRVLEYARSLASPKAITGRDFLQFVGLFDREDLAEMEAAIEEGCEQVDDNEW